jgi:hypothetical protein
LRVGIPQTGGIIKFEIDPNGRGGYLESSLVFDSGNSGVLNLDAFF